MTTGADRRLSCGAPNAAHKIRGQAVIELALTLPFLIWLIYYMLNAFYAVHTSHVAQRYAAMGLYQRLNNRAQFVMDDVANQLHNQNRMAVEYLDTDGEIPRRKIFLGPVEINTAVGICREPGC